MTGYGGGASVAAGALVFSASPGDRTIHYEIVRE